MVRGGKLPVVSEADQLSTARKRPIALEYDPNGTAHIRLAHLVDLGSSTDLAWTPLGPTKT